MAQTDSHGRHINYLRLSVTDRCNLRCSYCMPADGVVKLPHDDILRFEELERIAVQAVGLGIEKIRITGGEPLVRRGVVEFAAKLAAIVFEIRLKGDIACSHGIHDLTLTPKDGGAPIYRKNRYMDVWRKNSEGSWKLLMYVDNQDVPDPFRPESI